MPNVDGQLMVLKKHLHRGNGKMKRRVFHDPFDHERVKELAEKYAAYDDEDYLVVQVLYEASKPPKKAGGERSLGMKPA